MTSMTFYKNNSDHIEVNKSLQVVASDVPCVIIDATSIKDPVLMFSKYLEPLSYNYVYVPQFNRYYYAEEPPQYENGFYTIKLHVDVLMSFKNQFLNEEVVVDRSESNYNLYLPDDKIELYGYSYYQVKKLIPQTNLKFDMNIEQFVLNCAGGV